MRYGLQLEEVRHQMTAGAWLCPHCYEEDCPDEVQLCSTCLISVEQADHVRMTEATQLICLVVPLAKTPVASMLVYKVVCRVVQNGAFEAKLSYDIACVFRIMMCGTWLGRSALYHPFPWLRDQKVPLLLWLA